MALDRGEELDRGRRGIRYWLLLVLAAVAGAGTAAYATLR
jgi:hypothetical protein